MKLQCEASLSLRWSPTQTFGLVEGTLVHALKIGEVIALIIWHVLGGRAFIVEFGLQQVVGGMEVSDAKKLKALEAENAKLKKLLAEQMMDVSTLKEMLGKTGSRRRAVDWAMTEKRYNQKRAFALAGIDPRVYRRVPKRPADTDLRDLFDNLRHARNLIAAWRIDFNHNRPHTSLAGLTPAEYANRSKEDQNLNRANLK